MPVSNIAFFLRFGLTSYAAIFFFAAGLGFALSYAGSLKHTDFGLLFFFMAAALCFSFKSEPLQGRLIIAAIWASIVWAGFRFGRKIRMR
ncbi:MAG TPA: hypothetical protein VL688_03275 [Verrucomicrobiae bacterium]|jgi:hypothetical protein|nr:hypothetical protein [Verrucomicrobiae bacterium]